MKTRFGFLTAILALSFLLFAGSATARECDSEKPHMLYYAAANNYAKFTGSYTGYLRGDKLCVTMYIERIDEDGNVEGKYAHGVWKDWGIKDTAIYPFLGKIDESGEGKVYPGDREISIDIDPGEGTMEFVFHGKSTDTPGDLVRSGPPPAAGDTASVQ